MTARKSSNASYSLNEAKINEQLTGREFFDGYLRLYSAHSNVRGIPFIGDGFKEAQRKALWGVLARGESSGLDTVERIASSACSTTDYHHAAGSMQGTLVGLAQDFAGTNNMNWLEPKGQFGSRRSHGAAAARYLRTQLHSNFREIFKKDDDVILEQKVVNDLKIEPKYFIPLLPPVLLNGAEGMGTGHATRIFQYSAQDLKANILKLLDGKELVDHSMVPSWRDFTGKVERDQSNGQVSITGVMKVVNSTEIKVIDLPVGVQSEKYEDVLYKLQDKGIIKSFKDASDDTGFEFILNVPRTTSYQPEDELIKMLKLVARDSENLTVWNPSGFIQKYESVEKLLSDWVQWRLLRYEERRQAQLNLIQTKIDWLVEHERFIRYYLSGDVSARWSKSKKAEITAELEANNFTSVDRLMGLPIWSLTLEKIEDVLADLTKERDRHDKLASETAVSLFKGELKQLKT